MDALCTQSLHWGLWRTGPLEEAESKLSLDEWIEVRLIRSYLQSAFTDPLTVLRLEHCARQKRGGSLAGEPTRVKVWRGKWAEKCPCAETHSREGRLGHKGEWQQFLLLTGLLTITYPVKEEAEINQTRMKSSSHLERGTKLSLFSGEGLSLRSQSARPESLVGESVREEPESAPVSPTRRRTIKNQAKALFISRWAWAFISSSFGVSDAAMG